MIENSLPSPIHSISLAEKIKIKTNPSKFEQFNYLDLSFTCKMIRSTFSTYEIIWKMNLKNLPYKFNISLL
jgi:hypothetical protein